MPVLKSKQQNVNAKRKDDTDESDDSVEEPVRTQPAKKQPVQQPKAPQAQKQPAKNVKQESSSEEEEEESESEEETRKPAPKQPAKPAPKQPVKSTMAKKAAESSDEDSSEEESSEEEVKPKKPAANLTKAKSQPPKKQETSSEEEDSYEDSEEEETPKAAPKKPEVPKKAEPAKKPAQSSKWFKAQDSDDSEEEESDEDEKPKKQTPAKQTGNNKVDEKKKPVSKKQTASGNKWFNDESTPAPKNKDSTKKPAKVADGEEEEEEVKTSGKKPTASINKWLKKEDAADEEEDDEEEWDSDEDNGEQSSKKGASKDASNDIVDFDDDDEKRSSRSHREQRLEEIKSVTKLLLSAAKDNSWIKASDEFANLNKVIYKTMKQLNLNEPLRTYIKAVIDLEDISKSASKSKKALSTLEGKALQTLSGKVRKNNAQYPKLVEAYRRDPKSFEMEMEMEKPQPVAETVKQKIQQTVPEPPREKESKEKKPNKKPSTKKGSNKPKAPKPVKAIVKQEVVWTGEMIDEVLRNVRADRGKKGSNPQEQFTQLKKIVDISTDHRKLIEILMEIIAVQFIMAPATVDYMPSNNWKSCYQTFSFFMDLVELNPSFELIESDNQLEITGIPLSGTLLSVVERLDEEYTKSLQWIDHHTHDYIARVRDEVMILDIAERVFTYYKRKNEMNKAALIGALIFEHLYARKQTDHEMLLARQRQLTPTMRKQAVQASSASEVSIPDSTNTDYQVITGDLSSCLGHLVDLIYNYCPKEINVKTLLMHIFHHALHGRFCEARDMLMMSKVQDQLASLEPATIIMYHRAIAQTGLCAFSLGLITDAHQALSELCSSQRIKELLAQGFSNIRFQTIQEKMKKLETEKLERSRMIPYHMHISLDKLEVAHLVSAMLLDIPNYAQCTYANLKKKSMSKALKKLLDINDRQVFNGPPENIKEHINVAARALGKGDWRKCYSTIAKLPIFSALIVNEKGAEMLKSRIKTEALRTYLFTFAKHYDVMSLNELVLMFELDTNTVHSVVSKMMINDEFLATWDQPSQTIIVSHAEPSVLQFSALLLADRVNSLLDHNERLFDFKTGIASYGQKETSTKEGYRGSRSGTSNRGTSSRQGKGSSLRRTQQKRQTRS